MSVDLKQFEKFDKWIVEEVDRGFYEVLYNNPATLNAYAEEDWRAYHEILTVLDSEEDVNVILIASAFPKAFSSGLNLKAASLILSGKEEASYGVRRNFMYQHIREFQDAIATPARIRTPTIALLNGVCYGLALDIASACTIRVVTADAKLSIREIKIGLVADMGSLQRMTNLVNNRSLMSQYALTGEVFSGQDAFALGFVSKVVSDFPAGLAYCRELGSNIASNVPWAIKGTKESIQYMVDGGNHETGLLNIANYNAENLVGGIPNGMLKL